MVSGILYRTYVFYLFFSRCWVAKARRGRCIAEFVGRYCERCFCFLYRHLHRLIFMIWTQQETGKSLSKLGRITRLPWICTRNPKPYTLLAALLALIGLKREKFSLRLRIGRVIPTKIRSSQCYKGLQRTISHLKTCLLKDTTFILECKNRESLNIIIGQLFGS